MPLAPRPVVRVDVTGAAGQIGYSLVFRIAAGDLLGPQPAGPSSWRSFRRFRRSRRSPWSWPTVPIAAG